MTPTPFAPPVLEPGPHARAPLDEADAHLRRARAHLDAAPPDMARALADVLAVFPLALRAYLEGRGSAPVPEGASLGDLAGRAVALASIFKTPVHRAGVLAARSGAIAQAAQAGRRLGVAEREDVEMGWYTARNLLLAVRRELAAAHS